MKPNLFIPGFAKSGTSSLHTMLTTHPQIAEEESKEPHTYTWDNRYRHRESFFKKNFDRKDSTYLLDSSTSYMISKYAIDRIIKDTPDAKFIIIARDPIDRIISHYNWLCRLGYVEKKFEEEIKDDVNEKFNFRRHYNGNYKFYVEYSKYGEQYEYLKSIVPEHQILFLIFEDVFSNWSEQSVNIGSFLGLELDKIEVRKENKTNSERIIHKNKSDWSFKNKLIREYSILRGRPRSLKIKNPIKTSIERFEVENIIFPYLKEDLLKLKSLNIDVSSWQTNKLL